MATGLDIQMQWRRQLYESRRLLQQELRKALSCTKKQDKIELAALWRERYSENFYKELIRCAKNKKVAGDILAWNLDEFDNKKTR
jgi:hypothetical protein